MHPDLLQLAGRTAIVTGAGRGIGRKAAQALAACGAAVVINDLDGEAARDACDEIPGRTTPFAGDLTDPHVPDRLVRVALDCFEGVDIVVNNAGYNWDAPLAEMSDEQIYAMLEVHVVAPLRLLRAAAPYLLAQRADDKGGDESFRKVVNVSSVSGTMGNPNQANYNAAKAAMVGVTKGLAKEWGPSKVNVNAIAPGFIDTRLTALSAGNETISHRGWTVPLGIPAEFRAQGTDRVPLGRPGTPEEVASAILFLCSPLSDYVHGQVLAVTGGLVHGMTS